MTPDRLHKIESVFHAARERVPAERLALLAEVARSDPDLAHEVRALLAQSPAALLEPAFDALVAPLLSPAATLPAGASLGPYRIEALIGQGSMGEVYRAHDTRLGRDVAIKRLPAELRRDLERLARFEREARLLATLNHPHVAGIHGIVEADGERGLVLELIEGPTLAERLNGTALALPEALRLARQLADGLDAIHSRGVVHRDLKPANIKISPQGLVKLIDFGIGKAMSPVVDEPSPPPRSGETMAGAVLGTPAYMSPEQASGGAVDKRTDIWAFGCVLFEMLTGTQAFPGEEAREALSAVLGAEPDWSRLPLGVAWPVRRLLERCLNKDPARRLRDMGDALLDIDEAMASETPPADRYGWRSPWMIGSVGMVGGVIAGIVIAAALPSRSTSPSPVHRFSLRVPAGTQQGGFALSPDGTRLVYETQQQLYLQSLDDPQPRLLVGTANAVNPFFSPDGQWIAFVSAPTGQGVVAQPGQLRKVSVQGGAPVTLVDAVALGGSWGVDHRIVFTRQTGRGVGLFSVVDSGGTPVPLIVPAHAGVRYGWPHHLPDGRTIVFSETDTRSFDRSRIMSWAPGRPEPRPIVDVGYGARYVPSGHLVYALDGNIMAVPFDPAQARATGEPMRVIAGVETEPVAGAIGLSVAATGLVVYAAVSDASRQERSLVWVTPDGQASDALKERAVYSYPRLSPDGRRLAVGSTSDIAIIDLRRGTRSRIATQNRGTNPLPPITAWTPDGRRLTFNRRSLPIVQLESVDPDNLEASTLLLSRPYLLAPGSWSRSGTLAFFEIPGDTQRDLAILEPTGLGEPKPWLDTRFNERGPMFAPDGRAIAYVSDAGGRDQVYLRPYPGPDPAIQVSPDGGTEPVWSRDGRTLYFRDGARMLAVAIDPKRQVAGPPRVLFDRPYSLSFLGVANYDVAPDGRLLMIAEPNAGLQTLAVVEHWFEELKRLVPVR